MLTSEVPAKPDPQMTDDKHERDDDQAALARRARAALIHDQGQSGLRLDSRSPVRRSKSPERETRVGLSRSPSRSCYQSILHDCGLSLCNVQHNTSKPHS